MGILHVFAAGLKRFGRQWRLIASLAVIGAFGAAYVDRKIFSASATSFQAQAQVQGQGQTPQTQAPSAAPQTPASPGTDKAEPRAPEAAPADSLDSQTMEVSARAVAVLRGQGDWKESFKILSEAVSKVKGAAEKAGLAATGKPFVVFTETNDTGFHFEAMAPIAKAPEGKGKLEDGVEIGASPAGKALKFQHRGPYDDIDSTYEAITAYLDEKGLDTKNLFVEEYLTDLKSGEDESLEVDVYVFLK